MKKKEWILLAVIAVIALAAIVIMRLPAGTLPGSTQNHTPYVYADDSDDPYASAQMPDWQAEGEWIAVVFRSSRVLLYFDSAADGDYTVYGNVGHMHIEVKDGRWHVADVDCYDYTCKNMGWMDTESLLPIICLPNDLVVIDAKTAANMINGGQ